jgi:hypothetical protein
MYNVICKSMQSAVTTILKAHHLHSRFEASSDFYVKIANEPYMPLSIEKHGKQVTLSHYFEQNGDLIPDPDMEFEIECNGDWYPVAIQFAIGTYRRCVIEDESGRICINQLERLDQRRFSDMWAKNLKQQGFDKGIILKIEED